MVQHLFAVLVLALSGPAAAEPDVGGTWRATFVSEGGDAREARVVIDARRGTWKERAPGGSAAHDPCVGRVLPLLLIDSGASTVTVEVAAPGRAAGCRARRARLTIVDEAVLEGEFEDGRVLRLEREAVAK
ncbi:hypothetical protein V4F39_15685 [Aquincola sp. MAHUQ-54]|uniref:DUF306 domain-containing protein n=1 Tax=Aquincola agrisoli TaxID=3119538 RepID=A0AAW9QDW5_9BURK